jgi:choline dehydrogenase-like flavoprotein
MIIDAVTLPTGTRLETDVCIVGGGAAGITLAREFIGAGFRVALLESGGEQFETATQDLYRGTSIGRPFLDLTACRLRYFGGTTNHWGGWCGPYEPIDLDARDGLPWHGWPINRADLDPYYRRAQGICQIGPFEYEPAAWGLTAKNLCTPFNGPHFVSKILQQSPPTRFGAVYADALGKAPNVSVYLHANLLNFVADPNGAAVSEAMVGTLSGVRFTLHARLYILAAGGIENARLLLLSGPPDGPGLGNGHDLVGRFFMTNLCYSPGTIVPSDPYVDLNAFTGRDPQVHDIAGKPWRYLSCIALSAATMRELRLPATRIFWIYELGRAAGALAAVKRLPEDGWSNGDLLDDLAEVIGNLDSVIDFAARRTLFGDGVPIRALRLGCTSEQLPNPQSRVGLGAERDPLGLRMVAVDWQTTAEDKQKAIISQLLLGAEVGRVGFGRMQSTLTYDDTTWPADFYGDQHHMGTTRMHADPTQGVVDANCRVHGMANLFVAGSSVFATSSATNPTLTIVALALRLADHVKGHFT